MNQRERILELVKQGVITTEEALVLLENSDKVENETIYDKLDHQIADCDYRLSEVQADIDMMESSRGVHPLTEEQEKKLEKLHQQKRDILLERDQLQIQYYEAEKSEKDQLRKEERRENLQKAADEAKDVVKTMGKRVSSFVKQTSSNVQDYVKELTDRHHKTGSFSGKKMSHSFQKTYEFSPEMCQMVKADIANGNLHLTQTTADHISVDVNAQIFTEHQEVQPEVLFLNDSVLSLREGTLEINIPSKDYVTDITIQLPQAEYKEVALNICTGDIELHQVEMENIAMKVKHGAIRLHDSKLQEVKAEVINGNIDCEHCDLAESTISIANGALSFDSPVEQLTSTVMNGMSSVAVPGTFQQLQLMTGNGSIEMLINDRLPIQIEAETKLGKIHNHLADAIVESDEVLRSGEKIALKTIESSAEFAKVQLNAKTGSLSFGSYQHHHVEGSTCSD